MAIDLNLATSSITAALISAGAASVKDKGKEEAVSNAVSLYGMVLTELMSRIKNNKLYKEP